MNRRRPKCLFRAVLVIALAAKRGYSWTTIPPPSQPFFRPIPPDAAQELEDYFCSGKAVVDLQDLETVMSGKESILMQNIEPGKPSYESLEHRVRHLEVQLAQLLKYGIPTTTITDSILPAATERTTSPATLGLLESNHAALEESDVSSVPAIRTIQGIPYYTASTSTRVEEQMGHEENKSESEFNLKEIYENGMHMRGGKFSRNMASNENVNPGSTTTTTRISDSNNKMQDDSTSTLVVNNEQINLRREMEKCQLLNRQVLKQELEERGIDTKALFDKSEFASRLAQARLQEEDKEEAAQANSGFCQIEILNEVEVAREVEVVTDDTEPRKGGCEGVPTGGMYGFVQGGVVINAGNGDSIPDMQNYGDGGGAFGGVNPFVVAKVRECLANPSAFAKYYSDPDLVSIIRELRQQMP